MTYDTIGALSREADIHLAAARQFRQERDDLTRALERLLDFLDGATAYELQHAADYSVYLDAQATLSRVGRAPE